MAAEQGSATVNKIQGVEIYVYSSPTQDYDVIDTGKVMLTLSGTCNDRIKTGGKQSRETQCRRFNNRNG
jgi:hypothetical protein